MSKVSADPDEGEDFKNRMGLAAGVGIDVPVTDMISVAPEILYVQAGAKFEDGGDEGKAKINYIDIPILLKANFATSGSARPFIVVGPVLGVKAGTAKLEFNGEDIPESDSGIDDDISSSNFALAIGGGVAVGRVSVEVRYNFGLKDISKSDGDKIKSRQLLALVGFAIGGQ
jgi:opacity protein-like surface antigen